MAADGNALDVNRLSIEGQWVESVMSRLALGLLLGCREWTFGLCVRLRLSEKTEVFAEK